MRIFLSKINPFALGGVCQCIYLYCIDIQYHCPTGMILDIQYQYPTSIVLYIQFQDPTGILLYKQYQYPTGILLYIEYQYPIRRILICSAGRILPASCKDDTTILKSRFEYLNQSTTSQPQVLRYVL